MTSKPKIVIVGAVESTAVAIRQMCEQDLSPVLIITLPASDSDMHSDYVDLSIIAEKHEISLLEEKNVNSPDCIDAIRKIDPDFIFVIGWSRLCNSEFRSLARKGVIGYHPTLLPRMRGRAALAWTILLGVEKTGGTLFWMDEGVDSGAIAVQQEIELTGEEYLGDLLSLHMTALAQMIATLVTALKSGELPSREQDHSQASYLAIRRPMDGLIDWDLSAQEISTLIRSISRPYPGAFSYLQGATVRIWRSRPVDYSNWHALSGQIFLYEGECPVVRCGDGTSLLLEELDVEQPADSKPVRLVGQKRMQSRP